MVVPEPVPTRVTLVVAPRLARAVAAVDAPVPPSATAMSVPFQTPVVIVPTEASDERVVTAELTRVPDVGRVTEVLAVAVRVVVNEPEVVRFPARLSEPVPKVREEPEPAVVSRVPLVGSVTEVVAVVVSVVAKAPEVVRFPPRVIVLPVLSTPVPPRAPVN
jgi:hypothetical protein